MMVIVMMAKINMIRRVMCVMHGRFRRRGEHAGRLELGSWELEMRRRSLGVQVEFK